MLKDSAYLMQEAADRENRYRNKGNGPARPLYTEGDVVEALKRFKPIDYGMAQEINGITVKFWMRATSSARPPSSYPLEERS